MAETATEVEMIPVYIMGKQYMVPEALTIMKAIEYAGYQFIRGCGCRGGVCGACSTAISTRCAANPAVARRNTRCYRPPSNWASAIYTNASRVRTCSIHRRLRTST